MQISKWQLMFYVSWAALSIWLILKVIGVIQTPVWLEYGFPVASMIIGIFGLYQNLLESIKGLSIGLATLTTKFEHLDKKVDNLDDKVGHLDKDMGTVSNIHSVRHSLRKLHDKNNHNYYARV